MPQTKYLALGEVRLTRRDKRTIRKYRAQRRQNRLRNRDKYQWNNMENQHDNHKPE